jgi:hypothetical protein
MELVQAGSGRRVNVTFRVTVPDGPKFRILKVNEAERYTLIMVEPDSPAASKEDATVHEGQADLVAALAELDPDKDAARRTLLEETLDRLAGGGVDLKSVADILHRAHGAWKSHQGERTIDKGMAAHRVERDKAIRDLRASLARLLRWIRQGTPRWGREATIGGVLAAVKLLEQAIKSNSLLSAPTELLERLHPPAAVGPPHQVWNKDARRQLKTLSLDDATIADLLWAVGLVSRHPAKK